MDEERSAAIETIRQLPEKLEILVGSLSESELITAYIPGEWTVAQIVHHLADAHMNAFIRFKLVLVEDYPTFKPYEQTDWAETPEAKSSDISGSLAILRGLHHRWFALFENLTDQWDRRGCHPELGDITLEGLLQGYARHSENHLTQIKKTLAARGD